MKKLLPSCLLSALLFGSLALVQAPVSAQSEGSEVASFVLSLAAMGSVEVIEGSPEALGGSAKTVVDNIQKVGESTVVVLKNLADGSRTTLRLSGKAAGNFSLGVGQSITVTAMASGYVLSAAGAIIAYLPNELGKSLLHHSRSGA